MACWVDAANTIACVEDNTTRDALKELFFLIKHLYDIIPEAG